MGQNCLKFIDMAYESVKESDVVVFCDGGSRDGTIEYLKDQGFEWEPIATSNKKMIFQRYDQVDPKMNGRQRNYYLKYLKKKYPKHWCLVIDADEVVEDLSKIKDFINSNYAKGREYLYNVKMRHLIQDLAHEDATVPEHFVLHRLFRVNEADKYPEVEHPVLKPIEGVASMNNNCTTIWHLAYIPNLWEIKKRYDNHLTKSNMHTPEFLKNWYYSHIFGSYPKSQFNPVELPKAVLDKFGIDRDELYFASRRQIESKHYQDAIDWNDYFKVNSMTLIGCGFGQRVKILNDIGVDAMGIELSEYAVKNSCSDGVKQGSIIDYEMNSEVTIAYDVLEHINYEDLDKAIKNIIENTGKKILISVPFKGTPNCDADPTHIIKESRNWWIKQFTDKGLKLIKTPDHFLFKEQILIFKK